MADTVPEPRYSYPLDAEGFSIIMPSADSLRIYVSSSTGSDASAGTIDEPLKTIAAAMQRARPSMPDWIYLLNGDDFQEVITSGTFGGRSPQEPAVITGYGESANPRPLISYATSYSMLHLYQSHIAILGLHFSNLRNPQTLNFKLIPGGNGLTFSGGEYITIEDCIIEWCQNNITIASTTGHPVARGIQIRNNVIAYAYSGNTGFSQGIFLDYTDQPIIEGNLIHQNGWNPTVPLATNSMFNHGVYNSDSGLTSTGSFVRKNIFSNNASSGIQQRPGGVIAGNLFLNNGTELDAWSAGEISWIDGNVVTVSEDCPAIYAGGGLGLVGTRGSLTNNIVVNSSKQTKWPAIVVGRQKGPFANLPTLPDYTVEVSGNIVHNWDWDAYEYGQAERPNVAFNGNVVTQCRRTAVNFSQTPATENAPLAGNLVVSRNKYDPASNFKYRDGTLPFDDWQKAVNATGDESANVEYIDATRTIEGYAKEHGYGASFGSLVDAIINKQRKGAWDRTLTAAGIVEYFQQGYALKTMVPLASSPGTPDER